MKVIINKSVYEMNRKQVDAVLKVASEHIPFGIYAVEKDGIIELWKNNPKSKTQLKRMVRYIREKGFKVYFNESH